MAGETATTDQPNMSAKEVARQIERASDMAWIVPLLNELRRLTQAAPRPHQNTAKLAKPA